jgi:hypothetical protein
VSVEKGSRPSKRFAGGCHPFHLLVHAQASHVHCGPRCRK